MAILKSLDRMLPIGLIEAAECSFLLLGIFATYQFNWSIGFLLAWLLAGQLLELGLSLGYIGAAQVRPNRTAMHDCYALLRRSTPVGLTYGIAAFILRMDLIVLSVLASAETVGRFAAAHIILTFVYVVAWLFGGVLLPDIVRLSASGDGYTRFVERWSAVVFSATIPVSLSVFFTAPFFSPIVYGKGFADTGRILAVLALAIPFVLNNSLYFHRAIALGETRVFLGTYLGTAIVGLGLSLLCGATLGYMGIAAAIVIREAAMFGAFKVLASRPVLQPAR
jgi:O-antigen/teichoic acid export membrane protein